MSASGSGEDTAPESSTDVQITELMSRFEDLVARAREIAFPPWRKGAGLPPDMSGWSTFRRRAFAVSSPWPSTMTMRTGLPDFAFALWLIAAMFWAIVADLWFDIVFAAAVGKEVVDEQSITVTFPLCAIGLILLLTASVAYWSWIEFLRDPRYTRVLRIILVLFFVCILISSPFWLIDRENRARYPELLRADPSLQIGFFVTYVIFVTPLLTFFYRIGVDLVILAVGVLSVTRPYGRSVFKPVLTDHIRELALQPVPRGGHEAGTWRLTDLSVDELYWLRAWASTNRESSDKRLLPTVVLLAVVGVFADTDTFRNAVDKLFATLYDWTVSYLTRHSAAGANLEELEPSWLASGRYMLVAVVIAIVILFLTALFALFRNLVVQSLVIEACIVSEYANLKQKETIVVSAEPTPADHDAGLWQRLTNVFRRG